MAVEVELPDGSIVEFPDGTDNATMEKALAQYRAAPAKPAANSSQFAQMVKGKPASRPPSTYNLTGIPGVSTQIGGALDAFQHRVMNPVHGAAQFVQQGLGEAGLLSPDTVARDDAALRQREADFQARTAGNRGADIGGVVGDTTAALIAASRLRSPSGATSNLGRLAQGAAGGAVFGGAQPVLSEDDSRGQSALLHAALAAGGEGISGLFGRIAKGASDTLSPLKSELARRAQSAGIPLHVSQLADSIPLKTAASVAKYFPFSGAGKAAANQQTAFNRAVSRGFGLEADALTDDVMQQARRNLSARFEDIYARNNVPLSPDALRRLAAVEGEVNSRLTGEEAKVVRRQMDRILSELDDAGTLTGQKYQALRSLIMKAEGPDKLGVAVKEVRQALDDIAAKAVGPEDAATLKQLRGQWANLKTADAVLKQVAGAGGDIKPASLWAAIRKGSTKEMRELARIGQVLLKDPIPDSGTAGRVFTGGLLAGGATPAGLPGVAVALPAGAVAGRVLNSPAFGNYVVSGGGQNLQGLARLMSGAPYFLPAAAQATQPPPGTKAPRK